MTIGASSGGAGSSAASANLAEFRDPTVLTNVLKILLWITIIVDIARIVSGLMEMSLLQGVQSGVISPDAFITTVDANDLRQQAIGVSQIILLVVTAIIFLRWVFRANENARHLGAVGMKFTPGWAVGWYFVPIANLWKPYQAIKEIWLASADPGDWLNVARGENLALSWWLCFNAAGITLGIGREIRLAAREFPAFIASDVFYSISDVFKIVVAVLAIALISEIARMQLSHARATAPSLGYR